MNTDLSLQLALRSFQIASHLCHFRSLLEAAWCGLWEDEFHEPPPLQRARAESARVISWLQEMSQRCKNPELSSQCLRLIQAQEECLENYLNRWGSSDRAAFLERYRDLELDNDFDLNRALVQMSPLFGESSREYENAIEDFSSRLPAVQQAAFHIGVLLSQEMFDTFSGGGSSLRDPVNSVAYFQVEFHRRLAESIRVLYEEFPYLGHLDTDFSTYYPTWDLAKVHDVHGRLEQLLRTPEYTPSSKSYLGTFLIPDQKRVVRENRQVHLPGHIEWEIFGLLHRNRQTYTHRDALEQIWSEAAVPDPGDQRSEQNKLESALSTLRGKVKTLGLAIRNVRERGWRLEEIKPS
ncbi:hypothetical protein SH661x_002887 [Planctomicrobium sp. SH661]|uniref:hypothetical protein n=1 Tax=Planctomicrobium sp. SH661 TaxID=3448124 RepID=UPI003F5B38E2